MSIPSNIDEVLQTLNQIVRTSLDEDNYLGVFGYVYLRTTEEIKKRIDRGEFQDNQRMQHFDVVFANLYIQAFHDYREGSPVSESWLLSFDNRHEKITLIQHLLLGMSAHINLDLAIATSRVMEGKPIDDIARDFRMVNDILADITDEVQERLGRVSPLLFLLDWIGQRSDEKIADFSIRAAREFSWQAAKDLWATDVPLVSQSIEKIDRRVAEIGSRFILPRSKMLSWVLSIIARFESTDKRKIINAMRE